MTNKYPLLVCRPDYYQVEYQINPWMRELNVVKQAQAIAQWEALQTAIIECGGEPVGIEPQPQLPDMPFTANGGMVIGQRFFVSRFKYPQRQPEEHWFAKWFGEHGYEVITLDEGYFEGSGDAMIMGKYIIGGYGWRTDPAFYQQLQRYVDYEILTCRLTDARFYHLDTCFLPVSDTRALCYLPAMDPATLQMLRDHDIDLIGIPEEDALRFAANAVKIGRHIIMPADCPATKEILESLGFTVHEVSMSEFMYAGGACRCLTLPLSPSS
jgi:N-dimethylarginine dimethylaminohydrolase